MKHGPLALARVRLKASPRRQLLTALEASAQESARVLAGALKLVLPPSERRAAHARLAPAVTPDALRAAQARTYAQARYNARYLAKHPRRRSLEERERAHLARLDDLAVWARYLARRDRRGRLAPPTRIAEPAPARSERIGQWPITT